MRFAVLVVCLSALAVTTPGAQSPAAARTKPLKSFDVSLIDTSVDACTNFYQFACGNWRKDNPVPGDKARWGRFDQLREFNLWTLKDILEEASKPGTRTPIQAQVGDFYASCMDQAAIDAAGLQPIASDLSRIAAATSKDDLLRVLGTLRRDGINALFTMSVGADLKDSNATLMGVDQGGTSLPDRDYYVKDDPKNRETRQQYVAHLTRMFALAGADNDVAATNARAVLALETRLATAQLDRVGRRDPKNRDNKMTAVALAALVPDVDLKAYLAAAGAPAFSEVNVGWPKFFGALDVIWADTSLDDLKAYARWRMLNASAPRLASAFEKESFRFFSTAAARHQGATAAVADLRRGRRQQPGRSARAALRRKGVWRRQQSAHEGAGGRVDRRSPAGHQSARLDDAGDQGQGAREAAAAEQEQDRLSRYLARLLEGHRLANGLPGEQPPRRSRGCPARLRRAGQARGPDTVEHDAADGERLLLVAACRDRVSRRYPAAAVLRSVGGRGGELRRRSAPSSATSSRTASTTRAESSTARATSPTGGPRPTARPSRSALRASPISTRSTRRSTIQRPARQRFSTADSRWARTSATTAASASRSWR